MASANDRGGCADTAIRSEEHISTDSLERTPLRSVISGTRDHSYSRAGLTCAHKGPEAVVSPGMHRLGKVPRAPCEIHQEPFQQQQRKDSCCTFQECNVSNFPALSFSGSQFLSPGTILGSAAANNESNSTGCRSSRSINTFELISTVSLRRCSSSGAAPDHVPADRHSISACKGRTPRFDDLRLGFCCSHFSVGSGLYATPTSSRETGSNSSRVSNNSCSNGRCKSSTKHAPPWPPQRNFSFSGVTTRSPWNTRICACRPSPVVTANRSSSSSSGLQTLNSEFAGPAPLTCHGQALPDHRSSQCSSSRCSSSSQGCSNSSLWEGELGQAGTRCDSDKQDGTRIAEFDDPLLRLQSLRLRHQPRSPLLLLRCLSSQETDMLQQNGGDMCPLAADMPPLASDAVSAPASESLASAASLKIPASVESYYGFTLGAEVRSRVAAYEEKTALQRKRQAKLWEEYLANNPSFEDRGQLKKLVRQGIPDHLRGRVWASFLGADVLLDSDPDAFERLQLEELPLDVSGQIELDLPRTFPNNKRVFNTKHTPHHFRSSGGICALRRVLRGFAAARPSVGYCQGLNFLAGTLLLFQKQELALASLLQLVVSTDKNKGLQIGQYYSNGMIDLRRDLKVLELLIRQKSPRVFQVLKKTGVEVEWLAAEWFLCLFCTSCPQPTVLRIWDCLMLEGPKILFRVALGIIFYFETQLAKMHSLEQVMGSLKAKLALLVEHNELLRLCFHKLRSFPRRRLQSLQETVAAGLVDPIQKAREQQQHQQQKQQQTASQDRRRRRLLSFKRNGGQQPASELEHPQAPSPQHVTWREKLSRVGRVGLKKKESQQANVQGNSSFEGNNAAQDVRSNSSAQQAIRSQAGIAVQQRAPSSSGGRPAEASRHPSRGLFAS
ncbi:TBC domain-containing protein, putative [Eimeria tenella]|uniref:TBC domain-containing protein, putative n=1 Tax=Eimeria tenella TaxID=5802 RepID=U6KKC9_EIMTE|nr:TBC domain-containing protein, putative [Eimeria tenella]CDJ38354.1 TBC domain-containing protein, putative [Eimeria tenella]|eukprot:XP_013229192.1 TBC domain-containing protein, putative [Eimeria tenella]